MTIIRLQCEAAGSALFKILHIQATCQFPCCLFLCLLLRTSTSALCDQQTPRTTLPWRPRRSGHSLVKQPCPAKRWEPPAHIGLLLIIWKSHAVFNVESWFLAIEKLCPAIFRSVFLGRQFSATLFQVLSLWGLLLWFLFFMQTMFTTSMMLGNSSVGVVKKRLVLLWNGVDITGPEASLG